MKYQAPPGRGPESGCGVKFAAFRPPLGLSIPTQGAPARRCLDGRQFLAWFCISDKGRHPGAARANSIESLHSLWMLAHTVAARPFQTAVASNSRSSDQLHVLALPAYGYLFHVPPPTSAFLLLILLLLR